MVDPVATKHGGVRLVWTLGRLSDVSMHSSMKALRPVILPPELRAEAGNPSSRR
jgi:hypothetical protein